MRGFSSTAELTLCAKDQRWWSYRYPYLFAVVCDDVKCENFKRAFHAALDIFDYSSNDINTVEGSLGKRKVQFHPELAQAIEQLDYGNDHRTHLFDIVTVNNGTWAGLQAMAIGTNAEKRKKAAKIALAVAVVNDARCLTLQVPKRKLEVFQACTHVCSIDTCAMVLQVSCYKLVTMLIVSCHNGAKA